MRGGFRSRSLGRLLIIAPLLLGVEPEFLSAAPQSPAPPVTGPESPGAMVALRRLVRHFDFEEAETVPEGQTPFPFARYLQTDESFPEFGRMHYAGDHASGGRWSFRFDLDGGSMSARVPAAILNVMPLGDYLVSARVRTEGLTHARARLNAWLHDAHGQVIPQSIARSRAVRSDGRWTTLTVAIEGRFENAADLVLELQLAQPDQYLGADVPSDAPVLEDAGGRAWFDDVMVWHLPRIELSTSSPNNLVQSPEAPALRVSVRDLTGEPLIARLIVTDLDGNEVYRKSFDAPRGRHPRTIPIPVTKPGWYRADLAVSNDAGLGGRRAIEYWVLPPIRHRTFPATRRFAVSMNTLAPSHLEQVPDLVRALRAGAAVMPVWDASIPPIPGGDLDDRLRRCLERLLNNRVEIIVGLNDIPVETARRAGLDGDQVLELLGGDDRHWRGDLDELISRFGLDVSRWQVGRTGRDDLFWLNDLDTRVTRATDALSRTVPSARLLLPVSAEQQIPAAGRGEAYHVAIPYQVPPSSIEALARLWIDVRDGLIVTFRQLPADGFAPRQQAADLMLRALHGWRAGLPQMAIDAPWHVTGGLDPRLEPDVAFGVWRLIADQLDGRAFGGEFKLGDGVNCWILEGTTPEDAALVAWSDRISSGPAAALDMMLADGPVRVTDCTGATKRVPLTDGRHRVELGAAPLFIEDVSLELARFRESFAIQPDRIESVHRVHEHEISLVNPWHTSVSGTVQLLDTEDWRITPRVHRFDIGPRARVLLPVTIVFDRAALSGRKTITARIDLVADRDYGFDARAQIELGMRDVDFSATWSVARNIQTGRLDLVVTETVANTGTDRMSLDLFLIGPNISRQRRPVATLPPGGSVVRTFRIDDGVARLAGHTLRVGVTDRLGAGRLNRELPIPATLTDTTPDPALARQSPPN